MTIEDLKYDHLLGKRFTGVGQQDCYAMVRDFFKENFQIELENYARPNDWNADDLNLIEMIYEKTGFEKITNWKPKDLRPGDVLVMAINERNPNHLATYVGDSEIIHHLYGRFSSKEELRDFWFNSTCFLLRHPDVPDLRPIYPDVDILDIIRARNAAPPQ